MPPRCPVSRQADEWDLLDAILKRLKDKVDWATDGTCFASDEPVPPQIPPGNRILTVCLGDSSYDEATYNGAGPNALCEQFRLQVTILNQCALDSPPQFNQALLHANRGILKPLKADVLRALLKAEDPNCAGYYDLWAPQYGGDDFLRERGLIPEGWSRPFVVQADRTYVGMTLTLKGAFDQLL